MISLTVDLATYSTAGHNGRCWLKRLGSSLDVLTSKCWKNIDKKKEGIIMKNAENNRTYAVYSDVYTKAGEFDSLQAAVDYCRHNNGNQIIERDGKITRSYIVTTTDVHLVI